MTSKKMHDGLWLTKGLIKSDLRELRPSMKWLIVHGGYCRNVFKDVTENCLRQVVDYKSTSEYKVSDADLHMPKEFFE